jgi:hypothetical protein
LPYFALQFLPPISLNLSDGIDIFQLHLLLQQEVLLKIQEKLPQGFVPLWLDLMKLRRQHFNFADQQQDCSIPDYFADFDEYFVDSSHT